MEKKRPQSRPRSHVRQRSNDSSPPVLPAPLPTPFHNDKEISLSGWPGSRRHPSPSPVEASSSSRSAASNGASRLQGLRARLDQQESVLRGQVQSLQRSSIGTKKAQTRSKDHTLSVRSSPRSERRETCTSSHQGPQRHAPTTRNVTLPPDQTPSPRDVTVRRDSTRNTAPSALTRPKTRSITPNTVTSTRPSTDSRSNDVALTRDRDHWRYTATRLARELDESRNEWRATQRQLQQLRQYVQESNAHIVHAMEPLGLASWWPNANTDCRDAKRLFSNGVVSPHPLTVQPTEPPPLRSNEPLFAAHKQILQLELEKTILIGVVARAYVRMPLDTAVEWDTRVPSVPSRPQHENQPAIVLPDPVSLLGASESALCSEPDDRPNDAPLRGSSILGSDWYSNQVPSTIARPNHAMDQNHVTLDSSSSLTLTEEQLAYQLESAQATIAVLRHGRKPCAQWESRLDGLEQQLTQTYYDLYQVKPDTPVTVPTNE